MNVIDVADLKEQLAKFISWLEAGEVVHITRDGQAFACATPTSANSPDVPADASASNARTPKRA
ncbi:type II toxin-antitoxin system Phd/YefM family antitoxin [Sphingomonas faeni]|uniref:type II toxin-antitoxin system Phd/YefM family antitoxin n=1 Tax=Sphingomonas faeni TaxID=185950 RepID=UPI0020C75059|nr:hypothetical protein [Sphingomonas faeni]MCP8892111.1 hypothetical protein [Sphingomonas faeni]